MRLYASTSSDSSTAASAQEDGLHLAPSPLKRQRLESKEERSSNGSSTDISSPPQADSAVVESHLATLMVKCPDRKGVIAALAQLLYGLGCNILASDQFTAEEGVYFQRIRFDLTDMVVGTANKAVLERAIAEVADRFGMEWRLFYDGAVKRVAILVSRLDHCLYDILIRHRAGELKCEIPIIVSNHPDLEGIASSFGIPFRHLPVAKGSGQDGKRAQEAQIEALVEELGIDFIVLARYMQIFSEEFCSRHAMHTINIHHSFLPAFEGAKPYHRAYERGVKVIGATAHFATSELDAGPIIEQDVTRISHRDSVHDMIRKGRDLERLVLARALRAVLSDCVMVYGNRTVVFEI
ncbi:g1727 [Coccomyxa elongata]